MRQVFDNVIYAISPAFVNLRTLLVNATMTSIQIDRKTNKVLRSNHGIDFCACYESQIYVVYESHPSVERIVRP